jgi:hypothetical protein
MYQFPFFSKIILDYFNKDHFSKLNAINETICNTRQAQMQRV